MTEQTWIVVCDASRARLLRTKARGKGLELAAELDHAESRARARDLMADATGRKPVGPVPARSAQGPGGAHGRPGVEPDTDPKEVEAQKFARELAHRLEQHLQDPTPTRFVLVAPPHFLGLLRAALGDQAHKHVRASLDKDLTGLSLHDLLQRLEEHFPDLG